MYKFKKINKTKMYQLVKEFAGIRDLPPIRQCQFGYYSRSNTCYLCVKEGLGSFKVVYDHWGDDVYLLVSQEETYLPDFDVVHPERKDEVVHLNAHWIYDHGFLDKDSIREEAV